MSHPLDTPLAYCTEKVCKPASSLYYATVFLKPSEKAFWLGCITLDHELRQASLRQLDAGLTQVKLGWWRNALVDAQANPQATGNLHPVLRAIGPETLAKVPADNWATLIEQTVTLCTPTPNNTMTDWDSALGKMAQPWLPVLQAQWLASNPETKPVHNEGWQEAVAWWIKAAQLAQLMRLAKHLGSGFQPLPVELLMKANITAQAVRQREHNTASQQLLENLGFGLIMQANLAWGKVPPQLRLFLRPLRALHRMRIAEFKSHKASGFRLFSEEKPLSPLAGFGTAWTTHVFRR